MPRRLLHVTWALLIVLLALPIPFDNLFAAWAILFFCLALIEGDGVMAMLGWLLTLLTLALDGLPADHRPDGGVSACCRRFSNRPPGRV